MQLRASMPSHLYRICLLTALCVFARSAIAQSQTTGPAAPASNAIGVWRGTSLCLVRLSACKDEIVVYRIARGQTADSASVDARKIVNGREEEMGVITCHAAASSRLTCTMPQGVWHFTARGDSLVGGLTVGDGRKFRDVRAIRVAQ